jgi:hypothetical protein
VKSQSKAKDPRAPSGGMEVGCGDLAKSAPERHATGRSDAPRRPIFRDFSIRLSAT